MRRALTIFERSFGSNYPNVAVALYNLAILLLTTNRIAEADPLLIRSIAIDEASLGKDNPRVARHLVLRSFLHVATNRIDEAEPLMRRALAIDEAGLRPYHPEVVRDLHNLGALLHAANRIGEAEPLMRRALSICLDFTQRTGHEHPHLQIVSGIYRDLLRETGKSDAEIEAAIAAEARRI